MHLIFTGFMASGKTTIGALAANLLGRTFVDADAALTCETGLTPGAYIRRFGENAFRRQEKFFLRRLFSDTACDPFVLATGGGMMLDAANRRLLLRKGFVVWLDTKPPLLMSRLQPLGRLKLGQDRPLLPRPFSLAALTALYNDRVFAYAKAHCRISNSFAAPKHVAIAVVAKYNERACIPIS